MSGDIAGHPLLLTGALAGKACMLHRWRKAALVLCWDFISPRKILTSLRSKKKIHAVLKSYNISWEGALIGLKT